ncbi:VOC family protein [Kitasatospora sp. NPDC051914]|uniref:VOC family protein n=1 Tax=Kitasatospora sp. NPDC051914 TaxID=3154945 RepID=UPI00341F136D
MPPIARPSATVLDCTDPEELAAFYGAVTGWEVTCRDDTFVFIGSGPVRLGFQRVAGYRAPGWPSGGAQAHLDFTVDDPEKAAAEVVALGAVRAEEQPGGGAWLVMIDPAGHPFCLAGED